MIIVGPGEPVRSLKKAIELASDNDSILLLKGIYREGSLVLTKSLTITGETGSVLDGENKYETLLISGKNIRIKGIQFRNSGYSALNDFASVKLVDCSFVTIENNTITGSYFAIHVSNSSNTVIRNNTISGTPKSEQLTGNGIHLWKSGQALVEHNRVSGHRDGIYFEFVTHSSIRNNLSEKNIRYGSSFMFSMMIPTSIIHSVIMGRRADVFKKRMENNHFEQNWGLLPMGFF
jgi:nitrous oxidase accessory protein